MMEDRRERVVQQIEEKLGKCGKQRGNYIQNQAINSNHTTTKNHKNIIYLKNNKGVFQV